MNDNSTTTRYKAEMPQIPGVQNPRPPRSNPLLPLIAGVVVFGIILLLAVRWFSHSHAVAPARVEPPPQIEVPPAPQDPASLLPRANQANPVIAAVADLAKPWSS